MSLRFTTLVIKISCVSYPLTFLAWLYLPGDYSPASIALRVVGAHKPLHHFKVLNHRVEQLTDNFMHSDRNKSSVSSIKVINIETSCGDTKIRLCGYRFIDISILGGPINSFT